MRFETVRNIIMGCVVVAGTGLAMINASRSADAPAPAAEQPAPAVGQTTDAMAYIQACQEEVTNLTRSELGQHAQNMTNQMLLVTAYKRIKELEDAAKAAAAAAAAAAAPAAAPKPATK
jgi:hypothetical protein